MLEQISIAWLFLSSLRVWFVSELLLAKASAKDHGTVRLHLIFCYRYSFCVCLSFFMHYLGDGVKALGECCWDWKKIKGSTLLMCILLMPLCMNNITSLKFFHLSFSEVFLMLAKLLCTSHY